MLYSLPITKLWINKAGYTKSSSELKQEFIKRIGDNNLSAIKENYYYEVRVHETLSRIK